MMCRHIRVASNAIAMAGVLLVLAGCEQGPLHGAASMRVEVEVYKGPLSKEPEIQWGEFTGLIKEASNALTAFNDAVLAGASYKAYADGSSGWWPEMKLKSPAPPSGNQPDNQRVITRPPQPGTGGIAGAVIQSTVNVLGMPESEDILGRHRKPLPDDPNRVDFCGRAGVPRGAYFYLFTPDTYSNCLIVAQIRDDVAQLLRRIRNLGKKIDKGSPNRIKKELDRAMELIS